MRNGSNRAHPNKKRVLAAVLALAVLLGVLPFGMQQLFAAPQELTLELAEKLAYANSQEYARIKRQLDLAEIQYVQSVKSIRMKEKNQKTFRWSPLLNFKFPESPTLENETEYNYKPLELQSEIESLEHELGSCIYGIYEKVALQFVTVYQLQETIAYNEKRLDECKKTLVKNRARLLTGEATQTDIERMEQKIGTMESTIAADKRSFSSAAAKLSDFIDMDVTGGWSFASPFVTVDLNRAVLNRLIDYTLEHDNDFYKTRLETANGLLELDTNYQLMKKKYGAATMSHIDPFINQARSGEKLDSTAFKEAFNRMLEQADAPWNGKIRILFIRIPKLWFKGSTDGQRYVEDEPYVLYENALEYQNRLQDEKSAKKELSDSVTEFYETYISTKNTYEQLMQSGVKKGRELEQARVKNLMGELEYEEFASLQEEYEEMQLDSLEAQAAYSEAIFRLDCLTCGAVTAYLKGTDTRMGAAAGGMSYVVEEDAQGVYYYIHSLVSDNLFEIGITVPEEFEIGITDFELWVNGIQVGARTPADKTLRHLALDMEKTERVFLRLYDGDTFVDDCEIDPSQYTGLLTIRSYSVDREEETKVGTYRGEANYTLGTYTLYFTLDPEETAVSYSVRTQAGAALLSGEKQPVTSGLQYLGLTENSLAELVICFYDEGDALLYEAILDTTDGTIHKIVE